jgi:hypothetical protein
MTFSIYEASAPVFVDTLRNMKFWLDKAEGTGFAETLMEARLADDMRPLPAQFQMASDSAKNAMARLAGIEAPSMPDTETSLAELRHRCDQTIAFIESVGRDALEDSADREVVLKFPNGMGYRFSGSDYLRRFALPNFYFHATTAYAILRAQGVPLGKPDFLQHLGPPNLS